MRASGATMSIEWWAVIIAVMLGATKASVIVGQTVVK